MTTKRPIDVRLNPKYTSIINVLNRTTKRPTDVRLNPIYTSIVLFVILFNTLIIDVFIGFSLT
jgi:hypothetical protein